MLELEKIKDEVRHVTPIGDAIAVSPKHYTLGKIETWDFILDQKLNYCRGCALKYIVRAGKKDKNKEIEDLNKAIQYIYREIEELEKEKNDTLEKFSV